MDDVQQQPTRGFAAMDADRQKEIARKGGRAAHERGTAHEFSSDEARMAGRKGGERVSSDRAHMALIGRLGGKRSAGRRAEVAANKGTDNSPDPSPSTPPNGEGVNTGF